jgi:crossover junction endodeoxyribonuclease RuvC
MKILGVDPGLNGGLVLLDEVKITGRIVMPTLDAPNGKGREYDLFTLIQTFESWKPDRAILERAQPMPGQGVTSMFSIGKGYGILMGIISALRIPINIVHPRTWQKLIFSNMAKQDTKAASAIVAQRLWPGVDWRATAKCKNPHDGLTDAVCIAEWGRRTFWRS